MYTILLYNPAADEWVPLTTTDQTVRVVSNRYATDKTIFETDDPEAW